MRTLAIIGGGSWGTALATVLAPRFAQVRLWVYEADLAGRMAQTRENDVYLPGFRLASNVEVTPSLRQALEDAAIVLVAVPSGFLRGLCLEILPFLQEEVVLVTATKGIEPESLLRPSEIILETVARHRIRGLAILSGPSFAREVASGYPTAIVVASEDAEVAACIQAAFSGSTFRLYTSLDPVGAEIGGAVKNVVAIGAGVVHALDLGHNATAALITRGLAEITRLAVALGGLPQTLSGLAGLGDLVLTCTGDLSRNRAVGAALARGKRLAEITGSMRMIAEGVETTRSARELARRVSVEMPITEQMFQMLHFGLPPQEALRNLMERSLRGE
ncbi:MAG: NAD(P)-dependent glycerol-3-phosphate dehydrogenase [Acidobacteriia bacterium]|nr:NAD(P)-dependent glycerol-3-phosphate dehydrogenase [Terriglobia bacterium]